MKSKSLIFSLLFCASFASSHSFAKQKFFEKFFFYPWAAKADDPTPATYGLPYENVYFANSLGQQLHAWWVYPAKEVFSEPRYIFYAHGNAANLVNHFGFVKWLVDAGYTVFIYDYQGYGESQGEPTFSGLQVDTRSALAYFRNQLPVRSDFVVFGQSLGGVTLYRALDQNPFIFGAKAIILDSTFHSVKAVARNKTGWISKLMGSYYDQFDINKVHSSASLSRIPLLVMHGTADRVVPHFFANKITDTVEHDEEQLWSVPGADHLQWVRGEFFDPDTGLGYRAKFLRYLNAHF